MALLIATRMADCQIVLVAGSALATWLNVLQRGVFHRHVFATHPARHLAMQLDGDGFVNSNSGVS